MSNYETQKSPALMFAAVWFALAALTLIFMGSLVAEPKVLFGRSLTAIPPSLFPSIILSVLAVLCFLQVVLLMRDPSDEAGSSLNMGAMRRGVIFFGILTGYALAMVPFGFLISSAIATALLSWVIGNRSIAQIVAMSLSAPILLYLCATRLLAVSLPELNVIELFYAKLLGG